MIIDVQIMNLREVGPHLSPVHNRVHMIYRKKSLLRVVHILYRVLTVPSNEKQIRK